MYRFIVYLTITWLISCKQRDSEYIYTGKWRTLDVYNANPLKGNPREIKESFYSHLQDTTINAPGPLNSYELYKFDEDGKMVYLKVAIEGLSYYEIISQYGKEGPTAHSRVYDSVNASEPTSEGTFTSARLGNNKFRHEHQKNGVYEYHTLVTFLDEGRTIREARMYHDTLAWTKTTSYKNGNVFKEEMSSTNEKKTGLFYYSEKGFIDSIVLVKKSARRKKMFVNNEYGDPIHYEEMEDGKTTDTRRMKYEYDEKGNWTKRLTCKERNTVSYLHYPDETKYPNFELIVREIKY